MRRKSKIFKIAIDGTWIYYLSAFSGYSEEGVWVIWRGEINNFWSLKSSAMVPRKEWRFKEIFGEEVVKAKILIARVNKGGDEGEIRGLGFFVTSIYFKSL